MTHNRPLRQVPTRSLNRRYGSQGQRSRRRLLGLRSRLVLASVAAFLALLALGGIARSFAPVSNTELTRFDAIIVLGNPADRDGNPTPEQLVRVTEGVREYERGVAPRLIFTGGATRHGFVEARVMARAAEAQGIPAAAIFEEPAAKNTIQNACYSVRIMQAHGWRSAEVVSSASHLPRAGMIFSHLPLEWRTHAAPLLLPQLAAHSVIANATETLKTARYLIWARQVESCEP